MWLCHFSLGATPEKPSRYDKHHSLHGIRPRIAPTHTVLGTHSRPASSSCMGHKSPICGLLPDGGFAALEVRPTSASLPAHRAQLVHCLAFLPALMDSAGCDGAFPLLSLFFPPSFLIANLNAPQGAPRKGKGYPGPNPMVPNSLLWPQPQLWGKQTTTGL